MSPSMQRRRVLSWIGASALAPLAATPALAEDRAPTPRMTEGPFYPRSFPKDTDADLTRVDGHGAVAQGTVLEVGGRVLDRSGAPRAGARVEIWSATRQASTTTWAGARAIPISRGSARC